MKIRALCKTRFCIHVNPIQTKVHKLLQRQESHRKSEETFWIAQLGQLSHVFLQSFYNKMSQIRLLYYEFVNVDYLCVKNGNEDMKRDNDQPVVCNKIN